MTAPEGPLFLTQAEFARRRKVSRKSVTAWKAKGLLVLGEDGRVNVEETEWKLDDRPATYRGGVTHRPIRASGNRPAAADSRLDRKAGAEQQARPSDPDEEPVEELDLDSRTLSHADAVRRKENMLGLKHKLQLEREGGALVDRAAALKLFFDTARNNRDAWLGWPARIAIVMADELKIDARTLTTVLTAHVQQHLAELGEPNAELA